ncbi:venom phosphodiesterase-like [Parasteatoda tepidariorum]|uniref:venom phosphodiesterase-like n=1 Tax=Parasteatoda tepidariorum TaxID=114398 RepID=UPI0039BD35D9
MKAIFFAYGPSFKKNITARPFLNIELYELMSEIMNIIPQPNNGTKGSLHGILKRPRNLMPNLTSPPPPVAQVPDLLSVVDFSNCSCNESHYEMFDDGMIKKKNTIHLPFGVPQAAQRNDSLLLLYNNEYILAYDTEKEIPRWASFTITHSKIPYKNSTVCWSGDARVPNATCSSMPDGFITRPLFSPDFSDDKSQSQVFFVTNSILKSKNHTKMFEDEVNNLIEKKLFELGPINIMVGPVFDHHTEDIRRNLTSHLIDSDPIPSHVFVILTWCSSLVEHLGKCDPELLDVQSFLLPNFPFPRNCENAKNAMKKNGARIKEIERITGLTFYSNLSLLDAIRLKTSVDHLGL